MNTTDTKERILKVAASLFAQKGYTAIGVREIAKEAEVNISMISYYFQGKEGVLKEIINRFFDIYAKVYKDSFDENKTIDENLRTLVTNMVHIFREHTNIIKIGYLEMSYEIPEITELKTEKIKAIIANISVFQQFDISKEQHAKIMSVIGPVFILSTFSNFLLRPMINKIMDVEFNDAYYENYIEVLTSFLKGGIQNVLDTINS